MEVLHRDLDHAQHEHVRRGEPAEPIQEEPDELEGAGDEAARALRQPLQVSLGVGAEVQEAHEQTTHEEERVDAERAVRDGLEEESLLHHSAVLHVVGVLEDHYARVSEYHPGHRYRPEPVYGADGVSAHVTVADGPYVRANGEREQKLFANICESEFSQHS